MLRNRSSALVLLIAGLGPAAVAGEGWIPEYAKGLAEAKRTGKDLMVEFTGSDWCTWCIRMEEEVLDREEFIEVAGKDFVLVQLDFPRREANKDHVPDLAGNEEQSQRFKITGFPTVVLLTSEGRPYASTGYQRSFEGVPAYLEHFGELRRLGHEVLDSIDRFSAAIAANEGEDQVAAWRALYDLAQSIGESAPMFEVFVPGLQQAFAIDADGTLGLYGLAVEILIREAAIDDVLIEAVDRLDPAGEHGVQLMLAVTQSEHVWNAVTTRRMLAMIEKLEGLGACDAEHSRYFFVNAAFWSDAHLGDDAIAKHWARKARPLAKEAEVVRLMDEILARE